MGAIPPLHQDRRTIGRVGVGVKRTLVYDVTRLFLGPLFRTPRGIDRIDLLLARHFSADPETQFVGVVPTLTGMQVLDAGRVRRGLDRVEALWAETVRPEDDPRLLELVAVLTGAPDVDRIRPRPKLSAIEKAARMASLHAAVGFAPGARAGRGVPQGAFYLSVGHYGLIFPILTRWLDRRRDVRPVLMLHDVIPLDTPEFVIPKLTRYHARMVDTVARYGAGLIVSSAYARETVGAALATAGRPTIPTLVARLPLAKAFDAPAARLPALEGVRYFVMCGAIEPRKNHLIILHIWRQLCAGMSDPPHLVVVGAPGWRSAPVLDLVYRSEATRGRVHHVVGLSTPALKSLLAGACALLSPSLAEGFGLPIIEAEHLGVPVVASDIPAHREVAGPGALLLDPTDGPAWRQATTALMEAGSRGEPSRSAEKARSEREAYTAAISQFMDGLTAGGERDNSVCR